MDNITKQNLEDVQKVIKALEEHNRELQQKKLELVKDILQRGPSGTRGINASSSAQDVQNAGSYTNLEAVGPSISKNVLLATDNEKKSKSSAKIKDLLFYEKTQGVEDPGKEYEKAMCVLYALKLIADDNVDDFSMTTNNKKYGTFDDIELDVTFKNGTRRIFLFQLKYKEDRETINQHTLTKQAKQKGNKQPKSKFYLPDYLEAVSKLNTNDVEVVNILYTNRPVILDDDQKLKLKSYTLKVTKNNNIVNKDLLLNTKSDGQIVFCFKLKDVNAKTETVAAACQKFFIFGDQYDLETAKASTKEILKNLLHCDVYSSFEHFMKNWWTDNFVLTKHHVIAKLTELALLPYIQTISASKSNDKTKKLTKAITTFNITMVEESQEDVVCDIWDEISEEHDLKSSPLHKFDIAKSGPTELQKSKILWYLRKVPLIVKMDEKNQEIVRSVLNLLEKDDERNNLVLLGTKKTHDFKYRDVFETMSDLKGNIKLYHDVIGSFYVSLQDKDCISLEQLINIDEDITKIIRVTELLKMSQTECLLIGDQKEELPSQYIPRCVSTIAFNIKKILNIPKERNEDVVIINCSDEFKSNLHLENINAIELTDYLKGKESEAYQNNILVSTISKCTNVQFDQVCKKSKCSNAYVFQVQTERNCFLVMEKGSTILPTNPGAEVRIEQNQILQQFDNPLNVFCAPPGMGKSSLLKALSRSCASDFWVIRTELIGCNAFLARNPEIETLKSYIFNGKSEDDFSNSIKNILLKKKKMFLFLDGLDEVDKTYVDKVIELVKLVSSEGIRVWISSRNNLRSKLYQDLNVVPIEIEQLDQQQQTSYLQNKLKIQYDEDKIKKIVKAVFESADINNSQALLGIPMQLHLITETFLTNEDIFETIDQKKMFVLTYMYNLFFEGKVKTVYKKLGVDESLSSQFGIGSESILENYEIISLKSCLDDADYQQLDLEEDENDFLERIKTQGDKFGVIKSVNDLNEAIFSHQTYAEYFACAWFRRHKDKMNLLREKIFLPEYENLRHMFDVMMAENNPLHLAVIYKNADEVNKFIDHPRKRDEGGRTPLHLVCSYSMSYPKEFVETFISREAPSFIKIVYELFQKFDSINEVDNLFNVDCVVYAIQSKCLLPLEKIMEKKLINYEHLFAKLSEIYEPETLAYYAAKFGYPCLLSEVIGIYPELVDKNIKGQSLLEIAVVGYEYDEFVAHRCGNVEAVKVLLENDASREKNYKLLEIACEKGRYDMLNVLLDNGFRCQDGNTILHYMLQKKFLSKDTSVKVVNIAKELNIDFNVRNERKECALNVAIRKGHQNTVKLLMDSGADPNVVDEKKRTLLHYACSFEEVNKAMVHLLIDCGLNVNQQDADGRNALHLACECKDNKDVIELLLKKGADPNITDKEMSNVLHYACYCGKLNSDIICLLANYGLAVNQQDADGRTALHLACKSSYDKNVIESLLEKGADPNIIDGENKTALHHVYSCDKINPEIVCLLITRGSDVNQQDTDGKTVLQLACQHGDTEDVIKLFLEKGADPNILDKTKRNSLHHACLSDLEIETLRLLLNCDLDVNQQDVDGKTPLQLACVQNYPVNNKDVQKKKMDILELVLKKGADPNIKDVREKNVNIIESLLKMGAGSKINDVQKKVNIIELLLKKGADPNIKDVQEKNALHHACSCRDLTREMVHLLISYGLDLNQQDADGRTALQLVCQNSGDEGVIALLIEKGADPKLVNKHNRNSLHYACFSSRPKIHTVLLFIHLGVDINQQDVDGRTPLQLACVYSYPADIIQLLLQKGADPSITDKDKRNALHHACVLSGFKQGIFFLLNCDLDVNQQDADGRTPLQLSCQYNYMDSKMEMLLLQKGADPSIMDKDNRNSLHYTCFSSFPKDRLACLFIDSGLDVNQQDAEGKSPLHLACSNCRYSYAIVKLLLEKKADPKIVDKEDRTPLHYACCAKNPDMDTIGSLLNVILDVNQQDVNGRTGLQLACEHNSHKPLIQLLLDKGADPKILDKKGRNSLHYICCREKTDMETIGLLMNYGLDVNQQDADGRTALQLACEHSCCTFLVHLLLTKGADPNIMDKEKRNSLHYACCSNKVNTRSIFLLINCGLNVNQEDADGSTALQLVSSNTNFNTTKLLLLRHGANPCVVSKV